jgi:hypothetical protein
MPSHRWTIRVRRRSRSGAPGCRAPATAYLLAGGRQVTSHVVGRRSTLTAVLQRGIVTVISTAAERRTRSTRRCLIVEGVDPMKAYRTLWLSTCGLVGAFGTAVAVEASPVALSVLIVAYGVIGSLLTFCLVGEFWELGTGGRLRLLARGALVAGTSAGAFIGYATLLGPGVLLLAAATLASSPYAVTTSHRWLRSVRTPSAARLGAVTRRTAVQTVAGQLPRRRTRLVSTPADRGSRAATDVPRRARASERDRFLGMAGRCSWRGRQSAAVPHREPRRCPGLRLGRADSRTGLGPDRELGRRWRRGRSAQLSPRSPRRLRAGRWRRWCRRSALRDQGE